MILGVVLAMFSKNILIMESNEAEVVAFLETFQIFALRNFQVPVIVESNSLNVIIWVSYFNKVLQRFQFYFNKINFILTSIQVEFQHVGWSTNSFANSLAKQGVDRSSVFLAFTFQFLTSVLLWYIPFVPFFVPLSLKWGVLWLAVIFLLFQYNLSLPIKKVYNKFIKNVKSIIYK